MLMAGGVATMACPVLLAVEAILAAPSITSHIPAWTILARLRLSVIVGSAAKPSNQPPYQPKYLTWTTSRWASAEGPGGSLKKCPKRR
ncbi:hypothetical protein LZ30DRAFT_724126 [Colletotrichum cereale]|nr:hypothetical protein LZ30DRAFT_724126 [Colletotrichum cereale]